MAQHMFKKINTAFRNNFIMVVMVVYTVAKPYTLGIGFQFLKFGRGCIVSGITKYGFQCFSDCQVVPVILIPGYISSAERGLV